MLGMPCLIALRECASVLLTLQGARVYNYPTRELYPVAIRYMVLEFLQQRNYQECTELSLVLPLANMETRCGKQLLICRMTKPKCSVRDGNKSGKTDPHIYCNVY